MNTQELIDGIINLSYENYKYSPYVERKRVLELVRQLDEPQSIKLKDVIARIKSFDVGAKEVWLNEILNELGSDYGSLKYRAGYGQGRFDCAMEREKVTIPKFVADWIEYCKNTFLSLVRALMVYEVDFYNYANQEDHSKLIKFLESGINQDRFARAWLDGYEVEKEKRYTVKVKAFLGQYLGRYYINNEILTPQFTRTQYTGKEGYPTFTRSELEQAGFGWVFDCPGIEIEEVEE